jgi:predicted GNAT superfamily acetyltransferase
MSDDPAITIRRAETTDDYHACQDAQRRAWGITEDAYVVPIATMVGAQLHGGLVLGAFLADGSVVGVSFAFLGRIEGRLGLYSQLTGVVPGQQGRGIGGRLKEAQRQFARDAGLELLAWAFDPLQAGNAHFNLARLGARSHAFIPNMYGLRTDALNAGVPTDRLIAEWPTTPWPRDPIDVSDVDRFPHVIRTTPRPDGSRDVAGVAIDEVGGHGPILLEVPGEINRIRAEAPEAAERWRAAVSEAFTTLFARGFSAVDFVRAPVEGATRGFYVLRSGAALGRR